MSWSSTHPELAETFVLQGVTRHLELVLDAAGVGVSYVYDVSNVADALLRSPQWRAVCLELAAHEISQVQQEHFADHADTLERSER